MKPECIFMKTPSAILTAALVLFSFSNLVAADADNTSRNKVDKTGATKTPFDQSNESADIKLVASIRQLVVKDGNLSATAKNCKIITSGGRVSLRGPAAGKDKVENLLEVKAGK